MRKSRVERLERRWQSTWRSLGVQLRVVEEIEHG